MSALVDYPWGLVCDLVPERLPHGPGWYLIAANDRVECGPFASMAAALRAGAWLEDNGMGVHPGPWTLRWSATGLLIGSRTKPRLAALRTLLRSVQ